MDYTTDVTEASQAFLPVTDNTGIAIKITIVALLEGCFDNH
jgi:hypothetical protein